MKGSEMPSLGTSWCYGRLEFEANFQVLLCNHTGNVCLKTFNYANYSLVDRRFIMDGPLQLIRVVRRNSVGFEVLNTDGDATEVYVDCLTPEDTERSLVGILCNDLLVLCKSPHAGQQQSNQVDLWAVLRMQTLPTPASVVHGSSKYLTAT
jgi:hypothetical protein